MFLILLAGRPGGGMGQSICHSFEQQTPTRSRSPTSGLFVRRAPTWPENASMDDTATRDTYLAVLAAAGESLDELKQYGIGTQDAHGLLVLHGLAMYARDTARAAAPLLLADETLAAGALTRIVLGHAVLSEWLTSSATTTHELDRRAYLFLRQGRGRAAPLVRGRAGRRHRDRRVPGTDPEVAAYPASGRPDFRRLCGRCRRRCGGRCRWLQRCGRYRRR